MSRSDRPQHYKLVGTIAVPCGLWEWAKGFERDRRVARTDIGQAWVSTVFLGLDHNFSSDGPPLLFETMAFLGTDMGNEMYQTRCGTWAEAEEMHEAGVKHITDLMLGTDELAAFLKGKTDNA